MKRLPAVLSVVFALVAVQPVAAHVLITDESRSHGAILHIIPDDDPIAGEESTLYFDTQDELLEGDSNVSLTVRNQSDNETSVSVKIDGTLVTADYTFPVQGVYELTYTVESADQTYQFSQSQRVSRGAIISASERPSYVWAEIVLLSSAVGAVLLVLTVFNYRKEIAKHSTFK
jgi:hypothetical protein